MIEVLRAHLTGVGSITSAADLLYSCTSTQPSDDRMLTTLIESKRKKEASAGGTVLSIVFHVVIIALLVWVTANVGSAGMKERRQEDVKFVQVKKPPPPPKGFQVPVPPVNIPDKIPDVDLSKSVTNEADFSGKGQEGGVARGVVGGTGHVNNDQPYFEFQVEKPVLAREGNPTPTYPSMLESGRVAGEVMAQFVVDTTGRVDMSTF